MSTPSAGGPATGSEGTTVAPPIAPKAMMNSPSTTPLPRTPSGSTVPISRRSSFAPHGFTNQHREAKLSPSITPDTDKEIARLKKEYAKLEEEDKTAQERKRAALASWDRLVRETQRETFRVEIAEQQLQAFGH
ncbi:hypothetical protein V1522DRAFT_390694 [Lipomyces starkeyi]